MDIQKLIRPIQLYKIWFCYAYIYRSYMKHALLIKILNVSEIVLFTLIWTLSYRFKLMQQCNFIYIVLLLA